MAGATLSPSGKPRVVSVQNHELKRAPRPGSDGSPFKVAAVYDPARKSTGFPPATLVPPEMAANAQDGKSSDWVSKLKGLITKQV